MGIALECVAETERRESSIGIVVGSVCARILTVTV